jgi:hypothetical protein
MILSCNPSKKLDKLNEKHPELLAKFCKDTFPCVISKVDTITNFDTNYITIECPDYNLKDTILIKRDKIIKGSAVLKYINKTNTIIKTVRDSAQIVFCELELIALNKKNIISSYKKKEVFFDLTKQLNELRYILIMICLFVIFISLPLYGILSLFFGKYTNGYVWRISASFLSGKKPTITVFEMFSS